MARMKEYSEGQRVERRDGLTEAQLANCRAIYEDPVAYAEWRLRMGLGKPIEGRDAPVQGLFSGVVRHMKDWGDRPKTPQVKTSEWLAEYGRQPLAVSDAFKATLRRPEAAE